MISSSGSRFRSVYKTTLGKRVYGEISAVPSEVGKSDFFLPRRILKVNPKADIDVGEVIKTSTGRLYLLANNGDSEREGLIYKTFRLFELDRQSQVSRKVTVVDPLTGLQKNQSYQSVGPMNCVFEFIGQSNDSTRVPADRFRVITNFDLRLDDRVDDKYTVVNVELMLGVRVGTVQ